MILILELLEFIFFRCDYANDGTDADNVKDIKKSEDYRTFLF